MTAFNFSDYDYEDTSPRLTKKDVAVATKMKAKEPAFNFDDYDYGEASADNQSQFQDVGYGLQLPNISKIDTSIKGMLQNIPNIGKSLGNAAIKGGIEGINKLGETVSPSGQPPELLQQMQQQQKPQQNISEVLDKYLPSGDNFVESAVRRGLKEAPSLLSLPGGGSLPKAIAAGFAGEGAKELGLPEWAQTAVEITTLVGPDLVKKLLETGKDAELIKFMRSFGMSDEQITPLITSDFRKKWLSKLTPKGESTQAAIKSAKEGLGSIYESISKGPSAAIEISEKQNGKMINGIMDFFSNKLDRETQSKILPDLNDLLNNKITPNTIMNFWKDLNQNYKIGKEQLNSLKGPLLDAIKSVSPELAKYFTTVNTLYGKYADIAKKLKPSIADNIVSAAEALGLGGGFIKGMFFGDFSYFAGVATEQALRNLAKEFLLNPKYQQLSRKMVVALNQNKGPLAQKLTKEMLGLVKDKSPEIYDAIVSKEISSDQI
jgi:hypothetical protein